MSIQNPKYGIGFDITALFRNYLSLHTKLPWERVCEIAIHFDEQIVEAEWLSTDHGTTFEKTFCPKRGRIKNTIPINGNGG